MISKNASSLLRKSFNFKILGVVLLIAFLASCKSPEPPAQLSQIERLAKSINYKCPFMVDPDTRMDSVFFPNDTTFQYDYTLIKVDQEDVDIRGLTTFIGSQLLETVQTSSTMQVHRDSKLNLVFNYRDRKGDFVTQIVIKPEHYQ